MVIVRWRNLVTWYWRQRSHRWFCSTCMTIGWRRSRHTRRSVGSFWSCVQCTSTTIGRRWYSSQTRRPLRSRIISGRHWQMRSGSRLRSSWRIWSLLTTARRTSETSVTSFICTMFVLDNSLVSWPAVGHIIQHLFFPWKQGSMFLSVLVCVSVCLCVCPWPW